MADEVRRQKLSLDALIAHGLEVAGRPVDRIKVRVPGIGWTLVSLPLEPGTESGEPNDESELAPTQQRIMAVLKESKQSLTRRAVANALDRESIGGKFGRYVADLVSRGLVFEYGGEIADDSKKFNEA